MPASYLNYLNTLVLYYTRKYQDIPLEEFFKLELDCGYIPKHEVSEFFNLDKLKQHLIRFQNDRKAASQERVPFHIKYIYAKEFYWSIAGLFFGEELNVSKRLLFTELMYLRENIFATMGDGYDPTLNEGNTYFGRALTGYYEKFGNHFGMNGNFFRPEDMSITVDAPISKLHETMNLYFSTAIDPIDDVIQTHFPLLKYG